MTFDPCPEHITRIVLKAGAIIRELKGLPIEMNITTLYNETAPMLGVSVMQMTSRDANHLPGPEETGPFGICPKCSKKTLVIKGICGSCKKAEGGKYKTEWKCKECDFDEVSPLFLVQAYNLFEIPIPEGMKHRLGIKTVTDNGEK